MYLIVGLGNPGKKYEETRHNIGFMTLDLLGKRNDIEINKLKFNGAYGEGRIGKNKVILLKPLTYMNNSGQAVREIANYYKIDMDKIIIIMDDIDIEPYTVRVKSKGSGGTHNGMKSVINHMGNNNITRVKIGVGKNEIGMDLADFVLSKFPKNNSEEIKEVTKIAVEAVEEIVENGIDKAMNKFN